MSPAYDKVLEWLTRDYESYHYWVDFARKAYLLSNGVSEHARVMVADVLRRHITGQSQGPIEVATWNHDYSSVDVVELTPPPAKKISSPLIDWLRAADYVLMSAATDWEGFDEENQRRKQISDIFRKSYRTRQTVLATARYLKDHPDANEDEVINTLSRKGIDINKTRITDAKAFLELDSQEQRLWDEETEPLELSPIPFYKTAYY